MIGREFALPLLEKLHPAPRHIPAALEVLTQQDLIHPLRVVPEPAYLFKHALVQDVVYDTLLLSQRKQLHAQTGAAIEALYADRTRRTLRSARRSLQQERQHQESDRVSGKSR